MRFETVLKTLIVILMITGLSSFQTSPTLTGSWIFQGGIYNGKKEGSTKEYSLQRKYQANQFDAYLLEKGEKPQKYQSGNYQLKQDSCLEIETYSAQPSQLTGKIIKYHFTVRRDTLILQGTLPTGMKVEEYWKKVK